MPGWADRQRSGKDARWRVGVDSREGCSRSDGRRQCCCGDEFRGYVCTMCGSSLEGLCNDRPRCEDGCKTYRSAAGHQCWREEYAADERVGGTLFGGRMRRSGDVYPEWEYCLLRGGQGGEATRSRDCQAGGGSVRVEGAGGVADCLRAGCSGPRKSIFEGWGF